MKPTTKQRLTLDVSFFVCCGRGSGFLYEDEDEDGDEYARGVYNVGSVDDTTRARPTAPADEDANDDAAEDEVLVASEDALQADQSVAHAVAAPGGVTPSAGSGEAVARQAVTPLIHLLPVSLYRPPQSPYQVPPPPTYPYMTERISRRYAILHHRDNMREQRERLKMTAHDVPLPAQQTTAISQ